MSEAVTRLNAALSGRYAIERELGEGGMATAYLAKDPNVEPGPVRSTQRSGPMELKASQFLDHIIEYCDRQFPMSCSNCSREFSSFGDFVSATSPIGEPVAYETVEELVAAGHPIGTLSHVNCGCGDTLTVQCGDTKSNEYFALIGALASDVVRTGLTASAVLEVLRREISFRVTAKNVKNSPKS